MAAYPSYSVGLKSTKTPENRYRDDLTKQGTQHSQLMHSQQYYRFSIIHPGMTGQQYKDLKDTHDAGPRDTYTGLTWFESSPSESYSVKFLGPPQIVAAHGNNKFDVQVTLRGWEE